MWDMSKEDLLICFSNYDAPLPFTELDWLRTLTCELENFFDDLTSHFLRFTFGIGGNARGMLVCLSTKKVFNAFGQLTQVGWGS